MPAKNYQLISINKCGNKLAIQDHITIIVPVCSLDLQHSDVLIPEKSSVKVWTKINNNVVTVTQKLTYPYIPAPIDI